MAILQMRKGHGASDWHTASLGNEVCLTLRSWDPSTQDTVTQSKSLFRVRNCKIRILFCHLQNLKVGRYFEDCPGLCGKGSQGSLACYSPWDHKVRHDLVTEQQPGLWPRQMSESPAWCPSYSLDTATPGKTFCPDSDHGSWKSLDSSLGLQAEISLPMVSMHQNSPWDHGGNKKWVTPERSLSWLHIPDSF